MDWSLTYFVTDLLTFEILYVDLLCPNNLSKWMHFLRVGQVSDFPPLYLTFVTCIF